MSAPTLILHPIKIGLSMSENQNETELRALIIEDEAKLANAIAESLRASSWHVTIAANGEEGFFLASNEGFNVVILDLNLPGRDGLEILRTLRGRGWQTPVLILTARDSLDNRVEGLDSGADDYLTKPFAFPELQARLRALIRRGHGEEATILTCGLIEIDRVNRIVNLDRQKIELTAKEYELIEFLIRHKGQVVSREMLAQSLWNTRARVVPLDNVIDVHIARLRAKMDTSPSHSFIRTVRGVGFTIRDQE